MDSSIDRQLRPILSRPHSVAFALYCIVFSFSAYFCMYAFRKPFSVGRYVGSAEIGSIGPVDWKILFVMAQVIGYTLSKFVGIRFISETGFGGRGRRILALVGSAELALLGFAFAPMRWKWVFLFLNGLPLGMIWGIVFGYLEGRRLTTLFGAALSASFIVSSGAVKSVGRALLSAGIPEEWMPFATGALFLPPLWLSVWLLDRLPPPTADEERERVERRPMARPQRHAFVARYWVSIGLWTGLYAALTAYRDFRDNFAREIWDALGYADSPAIFSATEIPIAILVLLILGGLVAIRDPRRSFATMYALMALAVALIGVSTIAFQHAWVGPVTWMIASGLGLFLAYVPFGSIFYDDLIATTGFAGTAGFMIYVSDAFGYVGSVLLLLYKNFAQPQMSWLGFFVGASEATSLICLLALAAAWLSLAQRNRSRRSELAPT